MEKNQNLIWEDYKALYADTAKFLKELRESTKEKAIETDKLKKQLDLEARELKKQLDLEARELKKQFALETREMKKETREMKKELERMYAESREERKELNRQLGGISNSNGEMAEAYFFNAFKANKFFASEKFDKIKKNMAFIGVEKEAEFDIVLFNGKSIALIEVKYTAKPDNISIRKIISRVEIFKLLCPQYKAHKVYLGVAAMSFRKGLEQRLHHAGIATVRQVGKKIVVYDKEVKAF
jgi:hypothetical protein